MNRAPNSNRPKIPRGHADTAASRVGAGDNAAQREAQAFAEGTLEEQSKRREHRRSERFRDHVSLAALVVVWLIFALFAVAMLILAFHYFMPTRWGWLDKDQLDTLRTVVFSGAITSTATAYFVKRVS